MSATQVIIMGAHGRMGKTLCNLSLKDPDLNLVAAVDLPENHEVIKKELSEACMVFSEIDKALSEFPQAVIIDFTSPEGTLEVVQAAQKSSNPVVIGTTGLDSYQQEQLSEKAKEIPLFWAPNMSVGINVLLELLPKLSAMLGELYDVELSEIHHKHKKDAPSGTALKLAQVLAEAKNWDIGKNLRLCREGMIGERPAEEIGVQTLRGGDVVGEHTVYFFGPGERIDVTHRAHSRETFAQGALRAAKWLEKQNPGKLFNMADMVMAYGE